MVLDVGILDTHSKSFIDNRKTDNTDKPFFAAL